MPGLQSKTIKSIMSRKLAHWAQSIEDEEVRNLVKSNTIITGGVFVSMLLGEPVNDFDVYFRTPQVAAKVAQYYIDRVAAAKGAHKDRTMELQYWTSWGKWEPVGQRQITDNQRIRIMIKSSGVAGERAHTDDFAGSGEDQTLADVGANGDVMGGVLPQAAEDASDETEGEEVAKPPYRPVYLSSNAITLANGVQLVIRFAGEPEEIHKNYDFVHCTCYWTSWDRKLVLPPEALECILSKRLHYMGSLYPICSMIRTRKFIQRGWRINAGQYLKMAMQISKLNLEDIRVLEEQLTGVDSAFFAQLIHMMQEEQAKDPALRLDSTYVSELIDRIF